MGLPTYLKKRYREYRNSQAPVDLGIDTLSAVAGLGLEKLGDILQSVSSTGSYSHVVESLHRGNFAWSMMRRYKQDLPDELERVDAQLYIGILDVERPEGMAEFRAVGISRLLSQKLVKRNAGHEAKDRIFIKMMASLRKYESKVYKSPTFPAKLRALIFWRDGYTCQRCLRDREKLRLLGASLEADHILAVVDGGFTTLSNGQTLCSLCNGGKHHIKQFENLGYYAAR